MIATHKALKEVTFKMSERPKVEIKPISKAKFRKMKKIQQSRMVYEDYTYLNLYGGKF